MTGSRVKSHLTSHCGLWSDLGKQTGPSGVQKSRKMGKKQEDEYMIISHTKELSRKKPGFGDSRLARRPAAGLMKHLRCGTFASATKKMCLGSADVPGPPEQNNDIITISVTDQTVHKVTGEGRPVIHTRGGLAWPVTAAAPRAGCMQGHCVQTRRRGEGRPCWELSAQAQRKSAKLQRD